AQTELTQDIVQQTISVITRIEPADRREAISDVSLRLSRHQNLANTPHGGRRRGRDDEWPLRCALPVVKELADTLDRLSRAHVADDDYGEHRGPDLVSMELQQRVAIDAF